MVIDKDITIDFAGFTYFLTEGVGSTGTKSNGFQILKGNTVTLKNGTLSVAASAADKFYILIQNYADLTVTDMILDGTNLDKWSFTDGVPSILLTDTKRTQRPSILSSISFTEPAETRRHGHQWAAQHRSSTILSRRVLQSQ